MEENEQKRLLSVLTAVHTDRAEHLEETWESIASSELPEGWHLEWCIQEDGDTPSLKETLPADERIRYGANHRQFGAAVTRNHALMRSQGEYVVCIDGDDKWAPGGLRRLVEALEGAPEAAWAAGRERRWYPDGRTEERPDIVPSGLLPPGTLLRAWQEHGRSPFVGAPTMLRREQLITLGGWPAVGRMDDACLLYALSSLHWGVYLGETTYLYRQWEKQNTQQVWSTELKKQCEEFTLQWVRYLTK